MQPVPDGRRCTRRYWMIDGLPELFMGGALLLISIILFALRFGGALSFDTVLALIPVLLLIGMPFGRHVLDAIKSRTTYPYTGYVEYARSGWSQYLASILIGFIIGWVLIEVLPRISLSVSPQVFPLITAAIFALVMFCNGYFLGMQRFYALALFCLLVGGGASLATDWYTGCLTVIGLTGVWLVMSGGVTFWRYRRMSHHQEYTE